MDLDAGAFEAVFGSGLAALFFGPATCLECAADFFERAGGFLVKAGFATVFFGDAFAGLETFRMAFVAVFLSESFFDEDLEAVLMGFGAIFFTLVLPLDGETFLGEVFFLLTV